MARLKKPVETHHALRMRNDFNNGELLIVGTGKNTYLWSGPDDVGLSVCLAFSGPKTLEKFARSLLKALGKGDV